MIAPLTSLTESTLKKKKKEKQNDDAKYISRSTDGLHIVFLFSFFAFFFSFDLFATVFLNFYNGMYKGHKQIKILFGEVI